MASMLRYFIFVSKCLVVYSQGFGGDTMVMARLQDSSRMHFRLEALSREFQLTAPKTVNSLSNFDLFMLEYGRLIWCLSEEERRNWRKRLKFVNGLKGIVRFSFVGQKKVMPPLDGLQRDPDNVLQWIEYSTLDAEVTWLLREVLSELFYAYCHFDRKLS